ncbi:unnamed protein product, partial [Symbiodinium sp. KB8]
MAHLVDRFEGQAIVLDAQSHLVDWYRRFGFEPDGEEFVEAERRAATRATLLDAAAEVLVERGLAGFTTTAVTDRAGVSNGALFRHFPTRLDLIAATVEHVLVRLRTTYETTFGDLPDRPDVETLLDLLWSAMSDTQFGAVLEVYTQARTDTDLLAAIHPIVAEHGDYVNALTAR